MTGNSEVREILESATIRFAGDSGDGMQLTGVRFSSAAASAGNDLSTFPDFPSEIRAPSGTTSGVSGFQVQFASKNIHTPGDNPDVLVIMNLAALKTNIEDLVEGGLLIFNSNSLTKSGLAKAGYTSNPFEDGTLDKYRVLEIPVNEYTLNVVKDFALPKKEALRCKNFFALGVVFFLFDKKLAGTEAWVREKFGKKPEVMGANIKALQAGNNYADTRQFFTHTFRIKRADLEQGKYRSVSGNQAAAMGFVTAAHLAGLTLFYGSYPITPATDVLHELSKIKHFGVKTFQAEDEIAAMGATIGAAYGGNLAFTGTSGPGLCLKSEAINLAVMVELPMVILNVQRAGPSTGLPTKTEQSDLLQAMWGRNGSSPVPVLAAKSPADCFHMALSASKIALKYMTPVILLTDGYIGNGSEPWKIPNVSTLDAIPVQFEREKDGFKPYARHSETLARPWALPGTEGLEHRIGGLEKEHETGDVSMDPKNHEKMVRLREEKIQRIVQDIPDLIVYGDPDADILLLGWGSTYGSLYSAVEKLNKQGVPVAGAHFQYLNPFPGNTADVLSRYKKIVVAELNTGQLSWLLSGAYNCQTIPLQKVEGLPFKIKEVCEKIMELGRQG